MVQVPGGGLVLHRMTGRLKTLDNQDTVNLGVATNTASASDLPNRNALEDNTV
jgi:hypothetical protein